MYTNNKIYVPAIKEEVHISRIVASFIKVMLEADDEYGPALYETFNEWLKILGIASEERRKRIWHFFTNGKRELEEHLKKIVNGEDFDSSNYADN